MKRLTITAVICLALSSGAIADERAAKQAANNLSHEHLICAAYAITVRACIIQKDESDPLAETYKEYSGALLDRGVRIGEIAGVSFKASKARLEMASKSMMTQIEKNCSNISILLQQHAETCRALHDDGPARLAAIAEQF